MRGDLLKKGNRRMYKAKSKSKKSKIKLNLFGKHLGKMVQSLSEYSRACQSVSEQTDRIPACVDKLLNRVARVNAEE